MDFDTELENACNFLKEGKPILLPTDTVIGLCIAVDFSDTPRIINDIKGSPKDKPIAWLVSGKSDVEKYCIDVPYYAWELIEDKWPGALTLILKVSDSVKPNFQGKDGSIALRCPDSQICQKVIEKLGCPLVASSANLSGKNTASYYEEIDKDLLNKVESYFLFPNNKINRKNSKASTIIDCRGLLPKVIRE